MGWPSNGKKSTAPLFCSQTNLVTEQALSANLFHSSWVVRRTLTLPLMDCAADWKSLFAGSEGPARQATIREIRTRPGSTLALEAFVPCMIAAIGTKLTSAGILQNVCFGSKRTLERRSVNVRF